MSERGGEAQAWCNLDPEACAEETIPAACRELGHRRWKRAEQRCGRARYATAWHGTAGHGKTKRDTPRSTAAFQERKREKGGIQKVEVGKEEKRRCDEKRRGEKRRGKGRGGSSRW